MTYESDGFSMMDLFRLEVETQIGRMSSDLLKLEKSPEPQILLESLMRASHSTKGAARMVGVLPAERLAHAMEDLFVAAQAGRLTVDSQAVDCVLATADLLLALAQVPEGAMESWESQHAGQITAALQALQNLLEHRQAPAGAPAAVAPVAADLGSNAAALPVLKGENRTMRLAVDRLDSLVNLSGEAKVLALWLAEFGQSLLQCKASHADLQGCLLQMESQQLSPIVRSYLENALHISNQSGRMFFDRLDELSEYDRRVQSVTQRMFDEVMASRMRPFSDAVQSLPRMARDLGRDLGKEVELALEGLDVLVDRDILERLDVPLTHLMRNAIDHGVEPPEERLAKGKPAAGTVRVHAYHSRGWLFIAVSDDGQGLDVEALRAKLVERSLSAPEVVTRLTPEELSEFIFLPGFSSRSNVTEISGRGVGLDLVRQGLAEIGGRVTCDLSQGGLLFEIRLPIALSIMQCLMVQISGEIYGFPLARLDRVIEISREQICSVEGRPWLMEEKMALTMGYQILKLPPTSEAVGDELSIVGFSNREQKFGLVVDRLLGKQKLVAHRLDKRLGKLQHVTVGAILQDGTPSMILDVDDLLRSMAKTLEDWQQDYFPEAAEQAVARQRVLVVDDSITVREVERNLLQAMGYEVDVAVDGMDGWNAIRSGQYCLVITDIDMPRMDGFELIKLIKKDPLLAAIPIIIVSYKDREEDKLRGLEVGADSYLTKASFHDDKFAQTVRDLIG